MKRPITTEVSTSGDSTAPDASRSKQSGYVTSARHEALGLDIPIINPDRSALRKTYFGLSPERRKIIEYCIDKRIDDIIKDGLKEILDEKSHTRFVFFYDVKEGGYKEKYIDFRYPKSKRHKNFHVEETYEGNTNPTATWTIPVGFLEDTMPEGFLANLDMSDEDSITEVGVSHAKGRVDSHASTDTPRKPQTETDEPGTLSTKHAAPETLGPSSARQRSRIGKAPVTVWIDPEYKRGLLMVKVKDPSRTTEDLVEEALDDLFEKHGVPPVPTTRKKAKYFTHGD